MMKKLNLLLLLTSLLLSACSIPPKSSQPPAQTYRLVPQVGKVSATPESRKMNIFIPTVEVTPGLDSQRITLVKDRFEQDYIADSQWPDELPAYLHSIIIDQLSETGAFASVSNRLINSGKRYKLLLKFSGFQAELTQHPARTAKTVVAMEAFLLHGNSQKLIMHKRYQMTGNHVEVRVSEIVKGLNQQLQEVLQLLLKDLIGRISPSRT